MAFALVFPGQGSQSVGMMAAYGESAVIRDTFVEARRRWAKISGRWRPKVRPSAWR